MKLIGTILLGYLVVCFAVIMLESSAIPFKIIGVTIIASIIILILALIIPKD